MALGIESSGFEWSMSVEIFQKPGYIVALLLPLPPFECWDYIRGNHDEWMVAGLLSSLWLANSGQSLLLPNMPTHWDGPPLWHRKNHNLNHHVQKRVADAATFWPLRCINASTHHAKPTSFIFLDIPLICWKQFALWSIRPVAECITRLCKMLWPSP